MDYVYEEDVINAITNVCNEKDSIVVDNLEHLLKKLNKKVEDMDAIWNTEQSIEEMKKIRNILDEIPFMEVKNLANSIMDMQVDYQVQLLLGVNEEQGDSDG